MFEPFLGAIMLCFAFAGTVMAAGGSIGWVDTPERTQIDDSGVARASLQRGFLPSPRESLIRQPSAKHWFNSGNRKTLTHRSTRSAPPRFGHRTPKKYSYGKRPSRRYLAALITSPPRDFLGLDAVGCIAVSIYHEARNQPAAGQYAVGSVILTRAATPELWGDTPCAVVQPVQFSYLTPDRRFAPIRDHKAWAMAVEIAAQVLSDGPAPALQGADHYHATYVWPSWNQQMKSVGRIADHVFWRSDAQDQP